jgi:DNA repair exonuclease SbcCD ATPase subunit
MAKLRGLRIFRVSAVDDPANPESFVSFFKRKAINKEGHMPDLEGIKAAIASLAEDVKGLISRDETGALKAEAEGLEKRQNELASQMTALEQAAKPAQTPEEIEKAKLAALPEDIRKRLEDAEKDKTEREAELKKAKFEASEKEHIEKAKAFEVLPVEAEKFGGVLKRVHDAVGDEDFAEVERVLKAADEAARKGGVFKEKGQTGGSGTPGDNEAEAIAKARAKELVEKSDGKLTEHDALGQVFRAEPELYEKYRASVLAGGK